MQSLHKTKRIRSYQYERDFNIIYVTVFARGHWQMTLNKRKIRVMIPMLLISMGMTQLEGCDRLAANDGEKKQLTELSKQYTLQEKLEKDFKLYCVNCGSGGEEKFLGLYQSLDDQVYGTDQKTEKNWGYHEQEYMMAIEDDSGEELTRFRWEIKDDVVYDGEETGFYYDFELPNGIYDITMGFYNPFSARKISVIAEDNLVIDAKKILKYKLTEEVFQQEVKDGNLQLKIYNPNRGNDSMQNPILSYIVVKEIPEYNLELLREYLKMVSHVLEQEAQYTENSYRKFIACYEHVEELLVSKQEMRKQIEKGYEDLRNAYQNLEEIMIRTAFVNGQAWKDDRGNLIQAHGGQVQRITYTEMETGKEVTKWWWVGEDKTKGAHGGICAYSSEDLYNWHFEGIVMRNVETREQLEEEEYFRELYADCSQEELDHVFECLSAETAIIERPKMIYNEKTGMYVLWFHADGPTQTSNSSYAAASAGVAVSKTPYGPFRFIERYRLNTCPEDQEDMYPKSKGMARDMNLFVDDDGTAYIIYSSEENLTLYISKLNREYTYLATKPEEAKYGEDFIRLFPGAQREAPALFKRGEYYYLMTSGCTGWAPNQARYYRADNVLGEWMSMGDPCIEDKKLTTFDSQSTCIFCIGEDEYIYMGDRWFSDRLAESQYIWLPVSFDEEGGMHLAYQEEWTLSDNVHINGR